MYIFSEHDRILDHILSGSVYICLVPRQGREWWSAANVLRRHEPFAACPENFITACGQLMNVRYAMPEELIVEEGDAVEHALIIETGCAKVHRQTRPGLRGCPDRTGEVQDSFSDYLGYPRYLQDISLKFPWHFLGNPDTVKSCDISLFKAP